MAEAGRISKYDIALGGLMKIRDHPSLVHWPPEWIASFGSESLPVDKREELVLKEVEMLPAPPNDYHSYIQILAEDGRQTWKTYAGTTTWKTYAGIKPPKTYSSIIIFMRDSEFLDCLYQKLISSIGQTIRAIGDSEI
jgi:hypothetical protein